MKNISASNSLILVIFTTLCLSVMSVKAQESSDKDSDATTLCTPLKKAGVTKGLYGICLGYCTAEENISNNEKKTVQNNLLQLYFATMNEKDPVLPCAEKNICPCAKVINKLPDAATNIFLGQGLTSVVYSNLQNDASNWFAVKDTEANNNNNSLLTLPFCIVKYTDSRSDTLKVSRFVYQDNNKTTVDEALLQRTACEKLIKVQQKDGKESKAK